MIYGLYIKTNCNLQQKHILKSSNRKSIDRMPPVSYNEFLFKPKVNLINKPCISRQRDFLFELIIIIIIILKFWPGLKTTENENLSN